MQPMGSAHAAPNTDTGDHEVLDYDDGEDLPVPPPRSQDTLPPTVPPRGSQTNISSSTQPPPAPQRKRYLNLDLPGDTKQPGALTSVRNVGGDIDAELKDKQVDRSGLMLVAELGKVSACVFCVCVCVRLCACLCLCVCLCVCVY